MKAKRLNETQFETTDDLDSHRHLVTLNSCDCPDYKFRKIKTGESCKHMTFIKDFFIPSENIFQKSCIPCDLISLSITDIKAKILEYIKENKKVSFDELKEKFGCSDEELIEKLNKLLERGEIYSPKPDIYVLL